MKTKTILAIIGLILCAALVISYFVFFGDSFKNVYNQIRDRINPSGTESPADDGEIPVKDRLFTHESPNFRTAYVPHEAGYFALLVAFVDLKPNTTYTLDWDCHSGCFEEYGLKPMVFSDMSYGMLYSYDGSEWFKYGSTTSMDQFWKLYDEGRLSFTTDDNGMFAFSFWTIDEAPSFDTDEGQAVYKGVKDSIHCYLY